MNESQIRKIAGPNKDIPLQIFRVVPILNIRFEIIVSQTGEHTSPAKNIDKYGSAERKLF